MLRLTLRIIRIIFMILIVVVVVVLEFYVHPIAKVIRRWDLAERLEKSRIELTTAGLQGK